MSDRLLILTLCVAEVLGMLGINMFPALLPELQGEWGLGNADAGWITGIYFAGYVIAAPVLTGLTDRVDARGIYLASTALGGVALLVSDLRREWLRPANSSSWRECGESRAASATWLRRN